MDKQIWPEEENETVPEESVDMDALLADARRLAGEPDSESYLPEAPPGSTPEITEDLCEIPELLLPEDPIAAMTAQMRELTEEVRLLRAQLDKVRQYPSAPDTEDTPPNTQGTPQVKKKNRALSVISSILFYFAVIAVVVGAFLIKSSSGGRPAMIAGYSAFQVLTSSMEDVYPKGSLIITKEVDANTLNVGDDITFMVSETSSVTHRIISITENFMETGKRGFETKGVMNDKPDKDIVAAANIVGEVIFCSKFLGDLAVFTKNNWPLLLFALIVIVALVNFLKWNARREEVPDVHDKEKHKKHSRT